MFIDRPDQASFRETVNRFYALFLAPGLRKLRIPNDLKRQFFVKDGFKVSNVNSWPNRMTGIIECKITESGVLETYVDLVDNSNRKITGSLNNLISVRI